MSAQNSNKLSVRARWDRRLVPENESCERNLLIDITSPQSAGETRDRAPMNIALVIDRSGSMRGMQMEAARVAAREVIKALNDDDRASVVIFDNEVSTLVEASAMDRNGKQKAIRAIDGIHSRGMTNLSAGWFEGARCVATSLEHMEIADGRIIILSDGHANEGICEPEELQKHAAELAQRGIKTSAVGIGAGYSPLQLDALVEGGQGRLHDAESSEDIVNVVLGELLELQQITVTNVSAVIECPVGTTMETMSRSRIEHSTGFQSIQLGDLSSGATREIAIRVIVPATAIGVALPFRISVDWTDAMNSAIRKREAIVSTLEVVPIEKSAAEQIDVELLGKFAAIWETGLVYQSVILNERHDFEAASAVFDTSRDYYECLTSVLPDSEDRMDRFTRANDRVKSRWDGRSKRQVYARSKKTMLTERDHRTDGDKSWDEFLDH
jgi:uncharacterized protein YegL